MDTKLKTAIESNSNWYKNCKSVRNRNGKICQSCPFRAVIEEAEEKRAFDKQWDKRLGSILNETIKKQG